MCALRQCMHPRVGPAGPVHACRLSDYASERRLKMVLHAVAVRLALPTRKARAVVGNNELQSAHGPKEWVFQPALDRGSPAG